MFESKSNFIKGKSADGGTKSTATRRKRQSIGSENAGTKSVSMVFTVSDLRLSFH